MLESQVVAFDFFPAGVFHRECVRRAAVPELGGGKMDRATSAWRLVDGEHGHHSALHVVVDVAVKHPGAGVVGEHVNFLRGPGHNFNHVEVIMTVAYRLSMPMRAVNVDLIAHAHHVPAHLFALFHDEAGQISKNVSVDGIEKSLWFSAQLIKYLE